MPCCEAVRNLLGDERRRCWTTCEGVGVYLGAAFMLRPKLAPMTAEQACVAKGGIWKVMPSPVTPADEYTQRVIGSSYCLGGTS